MFRNLTPQEGLLIEETQSLYQGGLMNNKGVRIPDKCNGIIKVELIDILKEVPYPELFCWSILELYATGDLGEGKFILEFEEEIAKQPYGLIIKWDDLLTLAPKFYQIIDTTIIGCKSQGELESLMKKEKELEHPQSEIMLRSNSYFFIQMLDSWCWQVFSKDPRFVWKLSEKFKKTEFLVPESGFFPNSN